MSGRPFPSGIGGAIMVARTDTERINYMTAVGGIQVIGDQTLGNALFTSNLAVPINQRSYKWEKEHVKELLEDLAGAIATHEPEYFLGSIVLTKGGDSGRPQVVDGQQRLATTMILLAAIRDYFHTHDDADRAQDVQRDYLLNRDLEIQEWTPKFTLNEADNEFFRCKVLLAPDAAERVALTAKPIDTLPASHRRISTAAQIAAAHVASIVKLYGKTEATPRLLEWIKFIRHGARVIWVTVPDEANAFVMFETLNDRGLDLSKADLLKNYLFGRSQDRIKEVQQRWFSMIGAIENVGGEPLTVKYIRHLWSSMYGPTRDRELFVAIKAKVKSKQAAIDIATELATSASLYAAIVTPSHELWNEHDVVARKHIATLNQLEMEQVRPLLLAIAKTLSKSEAAKCLRILVCCSVRFLIVGGLGGGTMGKHYAERAQEVRRATIKTANQLLKSMRVVVPGDPEFEAEFARARVSKGHLARYYLRALQQKEDGEAQPEYVPNDDQGEITLEHILPQSPSPNWKNVDEDTLAACARRIGNLALLKKDQNSLAGDAPFKAKRAILGASKLSLTAQVGTYTAWGLTEIAKRQEQLAKLAVITWPLSI